MHSEAVRRYPTNTSIDSHACPEKNTQTNNVHTGWIWNCKVRTCNIIAVHFIDKQYIDIHIVYQCISLYINEYQSISLYINVYHCISVYRCMYLLRIPQAFIIRCSHKHTTTSCCSCKNCTNVSNALSISTRFHGIIPVDGVRCPYNLVFEDVGRPVGEVKDPGNSTNHWNPM